MVDLGVAISVACMIRLPHTFLLEVWDFGIASVSALAFFVVPRLVRDHYIIDNLDSQDKLGKYPIFDKYSFVVYTLEK